MEGRLPRSPVVLSLFSVNMRILGHLPALHVLHLPVPPVSGCDDPHTPLSPIPLHTQTVFFFSWFSTSNTRMRQEHQREAAERRKLCLPCVSSPSREACRVSVRCLVMLLLATGSNTSFILAAKAWTVCKPYLLSVLIDVLAFHASISNYQ